MTDKANIHFLGNANTALSEIACFILANSPRLPDLSQTQVILNESRLATPFRTELLNAAAAQQHPALLGPYFHTLDQWLMRYTPAQMTVCDDQVRLLILVEALITAPALLKQANPWSLADSLLQLFDELSFNAVSLDMSIDDFKQQLARWYATDANACQAFSGLQNEAELIHRLWRAWHEQLEALGFIDSSSATMMALNESLQAWPADVELHLIGIEPQYAAQQSWLKAMLSRTNIHLWILGQPYQAQPLCRIDDRLYQIAQILDVTLPPKVEQDAFSTTLSSIFSRDSQLQQRAQQFARLHPHSAMRGRVGIYRANSSEQQLHAIDTQVRKWLLAGKKNIAIISENRLLARRLRALLDRADIVLYDAAGWTLSTTRAAASIESLLLCIEEDFEKDALLDLLKSGLIDSGHDDDVFKHLVYRLEHDIIQNEQITNNLMRYRQAILNRRDRLKDIWPFDPSQLIKLLDTLHNHTYKLKAMQSRHTRLSTIINALIETLDQLGMSKGFRQDPAGSMILTTLQDMQAAAQRHPLQADWRQFRAWLTRNLESRYFQPNPINQGVQLFNLAQAEFQHFDAIIIAGLEHEHFPGTPAVLAFFNHHVRKQLQLPGIEQFAQQRLRQFCNLLQSADSILLTYRQEQNGEPISISPWVNAIEQFHQLAYADNLAAQELINTLNTQSTQVIRCDTLALPSRQQQPRPIIDALLLPESISASAYQQMMNCPYQFFAAQCLKLRPPEEIQLALSKREYGERIHLCLQAFHSDVKQYPGPFTQRFNTHNRAQAIELLHQITEAVFADDIEQNYIHLGWYHQWLKVIPLYVDWHIENKSHSTVQQTEQKLERTLAEGLAINGRIDRIDRENDTLQIIDYKTGGLPTNKDVLSGEQVQLPFYALLAETLPLAVRSVGYIALGRDNQFKPQFPLEDDTLAHLSDLTRTRLIDIMQQIIQGEGLPAWENEQICQYCDMNSLCRAGTW